MNEYERLLDVLLYVHEQVGLAFDWGEVDLYDARRAEEKAARKALDNYVASLLERP